MNNPQEQFWNGKHFKQGELERMNQPSAFVIEAQRYLTPGGLILELGAGTGADTHFLLEHGHRVVATDISQPALDHNFKTADPKIISKLSIEKMDLSDKFRFWDESFDGVYSHLALHYFDRTTTQQIFDEIFRVLGKGMVAAVLLNSKTDPEFESGTKLEEDYFDIPNAGSKRYFSLDSLKPFITKFETIILDDKGSDPRRKNEGNLIRFIGRRPI